MKQPKFNGVLFYKVVPSQKGRYANLILVRNPLEAQIVVYDNGEIWTTKSATPELSNSHPFTLRDNNSGAKKLVIKFNSMLFSISHFHILKLAFGGEENIPQQQQKTIDNYRKWQENRQQGIKSDFRKRRFPE